MKIWILTKGTDIDPTQILGAFDRELGYAHFATEATAMHKQSCPSLFGADEDEAPFNPIDEATRAADDDSLYLEIRGDCLTLTPHEYRATSV